MADFVDYLVGTGNQTNENTGLLGRKGEDVQTLPALFQNQLDIWNCRVKEYEQGVGGDTFIWGDPVFGIWNNKNWNDTYNFAFIFNHPKSGVLGQSALGSGTSEWVLKHVYNAHNIHPELFDNDRFIDTTESTGSWFENDRYYRLTDGQVFYTDYIAKEDKVYKSIKVDIDSELIGSDYIGTGSTGTPYLIPYAIINNIDQQLVPNSWINLTSTSNLGLKIKIVNDSASRFTMTFPINFGKIVKIREILTRYST